MLTKTRTIIISLIAAGSFATAAIAPAVSQAQTMKHLEAGGFECVYVATNFWECTNGSHVWDCESNGECQRVKLEAPPKPPIVKEGKAPVKKDCQGNTAPDTAGRQRRTRSSADYARLVIRSNSSSEKGVPLSGALFACARITRRLDSKAGSPPEAPSGAPAISLYLRRRFGRFA